MEITEIANKINSAGGRLYLVGGAVRDRFLGIDYIIPNGSKINDLHMEGDIDPASLNDIDGFIGVDKKLLENCRLEGDISIDAKNKENEEEDITDLDIDIKELQSDYEKNNSNESVDNK